jgi:hypothetical protein
MCFLNFASAGAFYAAFAPALGASGKTPPANAYIYNGK